MPRSRGEHCAGSRISQRILSICRQHFGRQLRAPGVEVFVELRQRGHADDGAGHLPLGVAERQRHLRRRQAVVARQLRCSGGPRPGLGAAPALLAHATRTCAMRALAARPGLRCRARRTCQSAGRSPAANRPAATTPSRCMRLVQAVLHAAADQAVRVLHRGDARQPVLLGQPHELVHAVGRFVRQADVRAPCPALTSLPKASSCSWMEVCVRSLVGVEVHRGRTPARCARASGSGRGRSRRSAGA